MSSLRSRPGVQSNTCPPTHQTLPIADGRAHTAEICLTCLLQALAPETPAAPCTLTDLQRQVELLLTALTQTCPSVEAHVSSKAALRRWAWETLNPSGGGHLGESTHRDASGRRNFCVGGVVADILNALFYRLVHHGDAVWLTQNDSGRACGAAFVDLVVFVFAAWELLLRAPGEASSLTIKAAAAAAHIGGLPTQSRQGISAEQSLPRRPPFAAWGYGDPTFASTYPGESSNDARLTSRYTALPQNRPQNTEEEGEETARYVSQANSAAVEAIASAVVARMMEDVLRLHPTVSPSLPSSQDMCSLPETPCHRSYTAVSLLYRLACQSPLFTRVLCYTDPFCTLVREMLPLYAARCITTPTLQSRKREREGEPTHDVAPPDVLHLLLHVIHRAVTGAAPNIANQQDPLATHLVAPFSTLSSAGRRSGTMAQDVSLLSSLLMVLEATAFPRVTAAALVILTEVFTWAATRAQLLSESRGSGHDTRQEADEQSEEVRGETELLGESPIAVRSGGTTAAVAPALRPRDFALLLGPLLLHQNGEVMRLACAALMSLLAHSAIRGPAITFAAAPHVASIEVAQEVEGYAAEALDACVRGRPDFCEAVVDLMERVAAVLCEAEESVIYVQLGESPGHGDDDDAVHSEGWQQQWRVIFRVASVDARLFDRLLCGPVLRRSIRMRVAAVGEQGGADWNCVVSAAVQCVSGAVSLSLHALLRLLDALAAGMGPAMCAVWPEGLNRLVDTLTERLEEQRHAAATAPTTGDENALLHHTLEPSTHLLLVHVTDAYLPHTGPALHRVALLLLRDLVYGRGLAAARCPERMLRNDLLRLPVMVGGTEDAEEGECRCLLSIAAHLLEAHNTLLVDASWSSLASGGGTAGSAQENVCCPCCATDRGPRRDTRLASLHELCAPQDQQQQQHLGAHVDSLLDVLLSLHPESPALMDARARFVRALFHDTAPPSTFTPAFVRRRNGAHVHDPLPLVGVASLTGLADACTMPCDAAGLLLALSTWISVPCVTSATVALLATDALDLLWREVSEATQRLSDAVVTATAAAPEEVSWWPPSYAVGERVACALQCYLALLLVYLRWYGSLPWLLPTPRPPRTANPALQHCPAASADGEESTGGVAQVVLLYMEESPVVRREVAWFWFYVASHYQVDVRGTLTALCQERDDQSPPSAPLESSVATAPAQQLLFSHLVAVTMLSALVYVPELRAERNTEEDGDATVEVSPSAGLATTASHMLSFLETIASFHCLADVFLSACVQVNVHAAAATPATASSADRRGMRPAALPLRTAPFAGRLLLAALLGDTAVTALRERASTMCVEGRLRYVLAELVYLVHLRDDSRNRRVRARREREAATHNTATTTAATCLLVQCLLSQHLTPLLRGSLQSATPSIHDCAADATTATLLRLTSLSLWCIGSSELSECDAVLTQYALRFVRLCRGLSKAEVHRSYAAAEAWENESAEADDVDSESDAVAREREEEAECGGERCVIGLPRLSFLVLQLLYLLLQRSNRLAVAAADTAAMLLFTAAAKAATASAAAREKRGCVDVHILAVIVEHCLHRLHRQKKSAPWYEQLDGKTFFRRITRLASSAPLRSRVEVLLAGAEYLLRLCPPNPPRWYEHPRDWLACVEGKRGPDISAEEWQAICVVMRHCLEALTALLCTNVFPLDHSGAVVGRLLFWLLSYYHWMMSYPVDMDLLLATFCSEGLWEEVEVEPTRQQLLAEGWLLAGLLNVLSLEPHWLQHHSGLEWRLRRFLARPAVAQKVRQFQHAQHIGLLSAAGGGGGAGDGGDDNDDDDVELCLLVGVLLHAIDGDAERAAGRRNSSAPPVVPLLPAGFVNRELAALQMWVPYTVSTTLPDGNDGVPLLLVLHEML